jgi:homopolymeric O-antigen transport system permease protein
MFGLTQRQLVAAADDIHTGIVGWRLGRLLAWQDIKQRYRRSTLGPIWFTLSSGVQTLIMGVMMSFLFDAPIEKAVPYVTAGVLFWSLITTMIAEGGTLFIASSSYLTQVKISFTTCFLQITFRNAIIFAHNFVIYIIVAAYFYVIPGWSILLWPLSLMLSLICITWIVIVVSIVSVRYRDIPMIVQNIFVLLFWLTPLMYFPEQLGQRGQIIYYNPFTHLIALVRAPLLGEAPSANDWLVCIVMAIVGWIVALLLFARFRNRIVYWL